MIAGTGTWQFFGGVTGKDAERGGGRDGDES